ncbi:MAG: dynamin family protein, partial [Deferribacteraceae bacterium]|nr:dynamin family protein [Deferribacteraceae bacterium]
MGEHLIERLAALEEIISKYDGFVAGEAARIRQDLNIVPIEALREQFQNLAEEKRLLNIGIIGRVKAGKSSLLNSVFFEGMDILPKAATPMTASLTIITYGENFSATVDYFTPQDINHIRQEYKNYEALHEKIFQQKKQELEEKARKLNGLEQDVRRQLSENPSSQSGGIEEKALRQTTQELKNHALAASFDLYARMKQSGKLEEMLDREEFEQHIIADNMEGLKDKLGDYIGSEGILMPFTKSVRITLSLDSLRNIQVVDTPGIN